MPWSSAAARFCTSELKTAIACRALTKRFVGRPILSVTGIRRAESAARSKAPVCKTATGRGTQTRRDVRVGLASESSTGLMPKSLHFCGNETSPCMSPIAFMAVLGFPAFGVLSSGADLAAGFRCESNQNVCRQLVAHEAEELFLSVQSLAGRRRAAPSLDRSCAPARPGQGRCDASARYWNRKSLTTCCSQRACRAGCLLGVNQGY